MQDSCKKEKQIIKWPDIESMHNVYRFITRSPAGKDYSSITYQTKVKLHGTNAGIQIYNDGTIVAQSQNSLLTPKDDHLGFAQWELIMLGVD